MGLTGSVMGIFWLIALVLFVVFEIVTMGLATIWFGAGALVAFLAAIIGLSIPIQVVLFFAVSTILLFATRPIALRYFNGKRTRTNADSLLGESGVVTETIHNLDGTGKVVIKGQEWTARAQEDSLIIESGAIVIIQAISGVKLIVQNKKVEV